MNDARELTASLDGIWRGSNGMARCPAHDDHNPSLSITEKDGRVLVKCFAGCAQDAVITALKSRGLWDGGRCATPVVEHFTRDQEAQERTRHAREIWVSCRAADQTKTYLRARGITIPVPPSLRFHSALHFAASNLHLPAMVAAVHDSARDVVAVHRTYLRADLAGKAGVGGVRLK